MTLSIKCTRFWKRLLLEVIKLIGGRDFDIYTKFRDARRAICKSMVALISKTRCLGLNCVGDKHSKYKCVSKCDPSLVHES